MFEINIVDILKIDHYSFLTTCASYSGNLKNHPDYISVNIVALVQKAFRDDNVVFSSFLLVGTHL